MRNKISQDTQYRAGQFLARRGRMSSESYCHTPGGRRRCRCRCRRRRQFQVKVFVY